MLVISDLHLGVCRSGGTTSQSQAELRDYLRYGLQSMLNIGHNEVTVNGDLFDGFTVDTVEVVKTYEIFADWLSESRSRTLNLIAGNHDWNPRGDKLSSFHLLCHFLRARFDKQVFVSDKGFTVVSGLVYCIPHMPNQSLFDIEVEKASGSEPQVGSYLLLHCNYKNGFAENSDTSLNLNDEQVGALMRAGWTLVLGHEHIGYELRGGRVIVVGNQYPSSVSDCLGDEIKNALVIDDKGHRYVQTWAAAGNYVEVDWQDVGEVDAQFIRVVGDAKAEQAADVIKAVSWLRQNNDAFVVSSAVKVDGAEAFSDMAEIGAEGVKSFDVLSAIYSELTEEEVECVKGLLNA